MQPIGGPPDLRYPKTLASAPPASDEEIELWHPENRELLEQSLLLMKGVDMPAEDLAASILSQEPEQDKEDIHACLVELVERIRAIQDRLGVDGMADLVTCRARPKDPILREWVMLDSPNGSPEPTTDSALSSAYETGKRVVAGAWWLGTTAAKWAPKAITAYKVVQTGVQIASSGHPLLALLVNGLSAGAGYAVNR